MRESLSRSDKPLAELLRPIALGDVVGQSHLLGENGTIRKLLSLHRLPSLIFWGPPGSGKTTLARLIAKEMGREFVQLSAVFAGVADLRKVFDQAQSAPGTIVFIDEIHRFNKSQQDALLGPVESGLIILIGATTENPSFSLNSALLSRARVLVLNRLSAADLEALLQRAEVFLDQRLALTPAAREAIIDLVDGDARMLLNYVETITALDVKEDLNAKQLGSVLQRRAALYDKNQEYHYNLISAFIKSMRGSDPDAALYWMARMLEGGEDPLYLARRLIRFASEDVGLADPQALIHALSAYQSYERLGSPEGELAIANAVVYLATSPKSNAVYMALKKVRKAAGQTGSLPPPKHILNAPTKLMREEGYGEGYSYDHDFPDAFSGQNFFPDTMKRQTFYQPVERGFEREIAKRLDYWDKLRQQRKAPKQ